MRQIVRSFSSLLRPSAVLVAASALLALSCAAPPAASPAGHPAPPAGEAGAPPPAMQGAAQPSAPAPASGEARVGRMWHGRVPAAKSEAYTEYLYEAGIKKIRAIEGNKGVQVFRRIDGDVAEFYVISYWGSRDAIRAFAGDDIEKTHNLPRDPEFLLELEPKVKHFDLIVNEPPR